MLQVLTDTVLLPYIIDNRSKRLHYQNLTSLNTNYLEIITFDNTSLVEHSEKSDSRPYLTSNIISDPFFEEYDQDTLQPNQDDNTERFQNTETPQNAEPQHLNTIPHQRQDLTTQQNLTSPSDTVTLQIISELSDSTINNTQRVTINTESIVLQIPIHRITPNTNNDPNQVTQMTIETKIIHPHYPQQLLILLNHLRYDNYRRAIMTQHLFHHNILLKLLHITPRFIQNK